jgi:glycerol-3-phosphate acyltransferase PlsY
MSDVPGGAAGVAVALVLSFLAGSIPFGVLVSRAFFRTDIRKSGSGNIGAANALRTLGKGGALAVLVLDGLKGFVPASALLNPWLRTDGSAGGHVALAAAFGFAALLGHCYSPWLQWRGGKGVATHLGVVFALSWQAGLIFIATFLVAALPTGFSSLGSLGATAVSALSLWLFAGPAGLWYGLAASAVIFWRHRENLARLRAGTENRMNLFAGRRTTPQ